jgi:spore coat polysaccharide biosynthesis protein SpsF
MDKVLAIIQARMGSRRLPGKVLLDIGGEPMLARVVERTRRATSVEQVVVATTGDASDDPVAAFCRARGIDCFRGSSFDVLDRFYKAALFYEAKVIVRLTADCPVIDPTEIDRVVRVFSEKGADFAANRLTPPWKRTYPIGLDTEVCSFTALERAWKEADKPHQREHVMPYLYEEEGRFRIHLLQYKEDYGSYRWTVDTPEDMELLRRIYSHFGNRDNFSWLEVVVLMQRQPELVQINAGVAAKQTQDVDKRMQI